MNAVVLGGTHDHIELIIKLKKFGYVVYLVDYYSNPIAKEFADFHIQGSTLNSEFVLKICIELHAKLCIACCIDQALLTMAYVSEKLNLPCHISFETAQKLTNKVLMKQTFQEHHIPTSKSVFINADKRIDPELSMLRYPLVVKPADANSSKGIRKVEDASILDDAISDAFKFSNTGEVVVEEFIDGIELSVDVIIRDSEPEFTLITQNIKRADTPTQFTIIKNIFDRTVHNRYLEKVKVLAKSIAKAFHLKDTLLLIQVLANHDDLNVIEFSARIGGGSKHHFIKEISNVDLLDCFLDILLKKQFELIESERVQHASMNYVYAYPGSFSKIAGLEELVSQSIIRTFIQYRATGTEVTGSKASTDRICGFMVVADSFNELVSKTRMANEALQLLDSAEKDIMIHSLL